jgi:hypothetical protein
MPHDLKVQDSPNCLEVLKYGILPHVIVLLQQIRQM